MEKTIPKNIERLLRSKNFDDLKLGVELTIDIMGKDWCKENFNFVPDYFHTTFGNFPTFNEIWPEGVSQEFENVNVVRDNFLIHIGSCSIQYIDSEHSYYKLAKKNIESK